MILNKQTGHEKRINQRNGSRPRLPRVLGLITSKILEISIFFILFVVDKETINEYMDFFFQNFKLSEF